MDKSIALYLLIMAGVTYLVRMLPLVLLRREIQNITIRSFLYYVPYVTLSVMTFPAILEATGSIWSGLCGLAAALVLAWRKKSLILVALAACLTVLVVELIIL